MAEIKSTMDLVMERAARIGKASSEELRNQEAEKAGVKLAVEYLDDKCADLMSALQQQEGQLQFSVRRGMASTLLRNVILPRDEQQQARAEKAVRGIQGIEGGSGEFVSVCSEVIKVVAGYMQHREQLRGQLEEQIRIQYENMLAQQPEMQQTGIRIDPVQQPKFKEEWSRVEGELQGQYGAALEQLKNHLGQRLGTL